MLVELLQTIVEQQVGARRPSISTSTRAFYIDVDASLVYIAWTRTLLTRPIEKEPHVDAVIVEVVLVAVSSEY